MKAIKYIADFMLGYLFGTRRYRRRPDLFKRRIIITIHPWAIPLIALALGTSIAFSLNTTTNVICLIITFGVVFTGWRMRQQMQDLRFQVHEILNNLENHDLDEDIEQESDEPKPDRINLKRVNGKRNSRVSEPS